MSRLAQDVRAQFPNPFGQHGEQLVSWFLHFGVQEFSIQGLKRRARQGAHKASEPLQGGVNVYAWFHEVFGIGEAGYSVLQSLQAVQARSLLNLGRSIQVCFDWDLEIWPRGWGRGVIRGE